VAGETIQGEELPPLQPTGEPDIDKVRTELHSAIDRARLHLEWVEIALILTQWRFEESTRQISQPTGTSPLVGLPDHTLNVLLFHPHHHAPADTARTSLPAAHAEHPSGSSATEHDGDPG
jgi:hypothetical protein